MSRKFLSGKYGKSLLFWMCMCLCLALPALASVISTKQEIQIGRSSSAQIEKKYGLVNDPALCGKIEALGRKLAANSQRDKISYSFKVLNQDVVNAFAFPGGFVYVTKGICKVMNLNQLSFVMGHEITHVEKRHSVKGIERNVMGQMGGSLLVSLLGGGSRKQMNTLVNMTNFVVNNHYSQDQEREADEGGMELMSAAGFDPQYAVEALEVLKKNDSGKGDSQFMNSLLSSHPLTKERIESANGRVADLRKRYGLQAGASGF
ncbi:M48 family metalloprotease [bacterium]|nr:M48 family metalloprotease [bacterium]